MREQPCGFLAIVCAELVPDVSPVCRTHERDQDTCAEKERSAFIARIRMKNLKRVSAEVLSHRQLIRKYGRVLGQTT